MSDLDLARVEREADVVGITAMGPQIRRAYDLADHFRARGKKVVLGGTWVSLVRRRIARPCRRRRRGRGGVRLVGRARRPRRRPVARHLPRRALARPPWAPRHRLVEPAAAQARRFPLELALPDVLLLADLLLARLPASLRVLRGPDVLRAQLPDAARRRRDRGYPPARLARRAPAPLPRRQPDRATRGGEGALPPPDSASASVGEPGDDQRRARSRAARSGRALRCVACCRSASRACPRRASPRSARIQPPEPLRRGHPEAARARHPGDRAHDGRPRRRHDRDLRGDAPLARGEQDQLPEALHAGALPRHQVPRRHGRRRPHPRRATGATTTTAARSCNR